MSDEFAALADRVACEFADGDDTAAMGHLRELTETGTAGDAAGACVVWAGIIAHCHGAVPAADGYAVLRGYDAAGRPVEPEELPAEGRRYLWAMRLAVATANADSDMATALITAVARDPDEYGEHLVELARAAGLHLRSAAGL